MQDKKEEKESLPDPLILFSDPFIISKYLNIFLNNIKSLELIHPDIFSFLVTRLSIAEQNLSKQVQAYIRNNLRLTTQNVTIRDLSQFDLSNNEYHFKPRLLLAAQLESYYANLHRLIAGPQYIPRYRTYIDNDTLKAYIGSKIIAFTSYHDNPLTQDDLNINYRPLQRIYLQNLILRDLEKLCAMPEQQINYTLPGKNGLQFFKANLILFSANNKALFKTIIASLSLASSNDIHSWIQQFEKMLNTPLLKDVSKNLNALETCLKNTLDLSPLSMADIKNQLSVKDQEKFSTLQGLGRTLILRLLFQDKDPNAQNFSKNGSNLDFQHSKSKAANNFLKNISTDAILLPQALPEITYPPLTEATLTKFPDIPQSLFFNYWPTHQKNRIEFIYKLGLKILELCKKPTDIPHIESFANQLIPLFNQFRERIAFKTPMDPVINIAYQIYYQYRSFLTSTSPQRIQYEEERAMLFTKLSEIWTEIYNSLPDFTETELKLSEKLDINKKSFTLKDNQLFKDMACHPIFIYYKNLSLLKYVLTDKSLYHALANLEIGRKDFIDLMTQDEAESLTNIRAILVQSEQFKQFLEEHGDEAWKEIHEEFRVLKEHYQEKLIDKPHYLELVDMIDLNKITNAFTQLKKDCFNSDILENEIAEKEEDEFWDNLHI